MQDKSTRVTLAQINFDLGNVEANAERIIAATQEAIKAHQSDLVIFPELTLTGYPPEDLLLRPDLYRRIEKALNYLQENIKETTIIVGYPQKIGDDIYNAACVIENGKCIATYQKQLLPNYSVFDEKRYFKPGSQHCVFVHRGIRIGLTICEDLWHPGPFAQAIAAGAELIISINASPFHLRKSDLRIQKLKERLKEEGTVPILSVNWAAGQDELVFDGGSLMMSETGEICEKAPYFKETLLHILLQFNSTIQISRSPIAPSLTQEEKAYQALVLGLRDYVRKNHFKGVLLGLSGGIDSALALAIAVDAIGADHVEAVLMPSRYTSSISNEDAIALAKNLKVSYHTIPIEPAFQSFENTLATRFAGLPPDFTEENIQARCRGVILMAISNKTGKLLLTTGNKSELAVGYATLYGDMCGGFSILKDVWKTLVYRLATYRNSIQPIIPERILTRPPSAELRHNQTDQDTLPPYEVLDEILRLYIEEDNDVTEITARGFDEHIVNDVVKRVYRSEYKRRQSPPGVRITRRAFGKDRRYPITTGYFKAE